MTEVMAASTVNTVTWWEIPVRDLEKAKKFYTAVFDWGYAPFGEEYVGVLAGEAMIGGLSVSSAGDVGDGVRIYVQVDDMEAAFARVESNGGATKTQRTEVGGDMGWWGNFTDPDGRIIGLTTNNAAS